MSHFSRAYESRRIRPDRIQHVAETLEYDLIEEALSATGTVSLRRRKLPAEQVIWLIVGMAMYAGRSIRKTLDQLELVVGSRLVPSSVSEARQRIGSAPLKYFFKRTASVWTSLCKKSLWKGLQVLAIDGTVLNVQDTEEKDVFFGRPGSKTGHSAYPQTRVLALLDVGLRMFVDAVICPLSMGEQAAVKHPLHSTFPRNSLCLLDRGF